MMTWPLENENELAVIIIFNHSQLTSVSIFFFKEKKKKKKKSQFGVTALSDHCAIKIKWVYLMLIEILSKGGLVTTIVSLKMNEQNSLLLGSVIFKSVGKQQAKGCTCENRVHNFSPGALKALGRIRLSIYICTPTYTIPHFQNALLNKSWYSLTFLLAVWNTAH